ncbi:ferredoxin reductase [Pseudonocardia endophytica]|uniref:Ferredoxin-NADP reductase n=1 Tax=Pseudonocardia endophytica TaxID=401976 RepID=A0A4R1HL61_PSEEN|nr:ferredoxin reductase [Pseudonocardia endophytica]TCK21040.1 ferredoxin-NADP reductase [Pseudonocardia endophytica]
MFRVAPPRQRRGAAPQAPRAGHRLLAAASALTTPLLPEDFLGLVDPLWSTTQLRGRVVARRRETGRAVSVTIEPGRAWTGHRAGQYVRIGIDVDGVRHWRSYSLSGAEGDEHLTITVQEVDDGVVSRKLVRDLPIGTIVQLEQAAGDFLLAEPASSLLFVTAGSGITPVMGMLRTLDRAGARPDVRLVHSAPTVDDVIFARELDALAERWPGLRVHLRHTRSDGRLTPADVDALVPDRADRLTYACGPAEMLDAFTEQWPGLRVERFTAPARSTGGTGGSVVYGERPVDVEPGASLLEAGEAAGVLMPSGCRMGICFGCVLPLRDGQVRDLRTGEVHGEPGDLVQTCISGASGDAVLDTDPKERR